ncbi:hypothetical protein AQUCO_03300039v1 [Aquilegia coerulea]|uniref:Pentacotripeptide-repeat region of PRORP domain-containing protein n=1 Tax=Aquilegia coerulea TaxID=218851 RepID=A0A2G5CZ97_AQUCA|nr:hypothetical protein AQUCO_03300039v1 [Aquilegia coerulea]
MYNRFQRLKTTFSRQNIQQIFKLESIQARNDYYLNPILQVTRNINTYNKQCELDLWKNDANSNEHLSIISPTHDSIMLKEVANVQNVLKLNINSSVKMVEMALNRCGVELSEEFVLLVLKWHRSEWKSALQFFEWVFKGGKSKGYLPGSDVYNEMLDILGRMKRFEELGQVFDEMSQREGLVNERTFGILLNRYAGGHKVEEAIEIFYKRREFGFEVDLFAFQTLLLSLCRYKHVEVAESLFLEKQNEFPLDIKTLNIILNGWCVLGSLREAKRFWKDIVSSKCKPDRFTYGIFINCLTKSGKLGTAVKLFRSMWKTSYAIPDVAICNCVIDALCFKKRIPEALVIFEEMKEKGCPPDVATYNSLIKHLCKIVRMEKVHELLEEMKEKKGCCTPNAITFNYLLKSMKKPEEVPVILERMRRNGCQITGDTYNLILKLFLDWNDIQGVQSVWAEMEKNGVGPDQRSYTIMIHRLHKKGRMEEGLKCYNEMVSKGMIPEPRTSLLVPAMKMKLKERENERGVQEMSEESLLRAYRSIGVTLVAKRIRNVKHSLNQLL